MSAEEQEADKTATAEASGGDEEEEWLYGDEGENKEEDEEAKLNAAVSAPADAPPPMSEESPTTGNGVDPQPEKTGEDVEPAGDEDSESDSDDDDDDVRVTIGDIKTGAPQYTTYGATPVNLNIKTAGSRPYGQVGTKLKGVDLEAAGSINGVPVLEVEMESFEEKPWRKPGADLSDYFNYGFNEDTWKAYCEKQKRLRMGLEVLTVGSVTSKITVQQGRTGNDKEASLPVHTSKPDYPAPTNLYKSMNMNMNVNMNMNTTRFSPPQWNGPPPTDMSYYTKPSGTIDVIGGQTATISRVEGRRRHNLEGNNIQVISEHSSSEAEPAPAKMPPFFPPGALPPNIPPPPFLPPPPNVSTAPPLIPPPRLPITVPPPGFPPPPGGPPPSLIPTLDSGHPGVYDGRPVPPYPFPTGPYPPPMPGAVAPWPPMMDQSKQWDYYPRREEKREKERERERPRERPHERERETREHSPSAIVYNSDEERYRYRDYAERGYGGERHRERASREKEDRHRDRRHREKEEGRHKSSRSSSSRRRHDSEEGDGHRRHKHKKSKRSKEGKDPSEELSADQENQDAME
ncbi:pre-mRNA 3'-end-processing factor FIP1 [Hypomesus transpacificus]|uniref:pre-mRNA 3'-end-processing factor FIP1 n=1 Tax=Hypomesus transpacificus TaxID=137520 RepID=UPI001F07ADFD|nr:pre-mRNA 3'-end-processing factor FIP1 [Hypomesus transpacificus]